MQKKELLNLQIPRPFTGRAILALLALSTAFQLITIPAQAHYGDRIRSLISLCEQGRYQEALKIIDAAIAGDPYQAAYYCVRGDIYADLHQYGKAVKDINQAITLTPNSALPYLTKGGYLARMGQFDEATISFTQALKRDPNNVNAYAQRGNAYFILHKLEKAKADLSQALKLDPKNRAAIIGHVQLLTEAEEYPAALAELSKFIVANGENDAYLYAERSRIYCLMDNLSLAFNDINKAVSLDKKTSSYLSLRGFFYAMQGRLELALKDFSRALEIEPADSRPLYLRGLAYALSKKCDLALPDLNKFIALNPKDARGYKARGHAYALIGESQKAIMDFTKCLTLSPESRIATRGKAIECLKLQRLQEATEVLDNWISKHPKDRDTIRLREIAQDLKYGTGTITPEMKKSFELSTQDILGSGFTNESSEAIKNYSDSSKDSTTLLITPAEDSIKASSEQSKVQSKTVDTPIEMVVEKKATLLPEWQKQYLADLERRIYRQWEAASVNTGNSLFAYFKLFPGGEVSDIRITGEAAGIPEALQAQIKNIIARGAPYKTFSQAEQLEIKISFKGPELHAVFEEKNEKQ